MARGQATPTAIGIGRTGYLAPVQDCGGGKMITVTVEVDEVRLRQSGASEQSEAEILDLLETMKVDGRLRLESVNFWLPVKDLKIRPARRAG
jgi:hypothetical protein